MLYELLTELRNWFCGESDRHTGEYEISGGVLSPNDFLLPGQYYRIIGSVYNDGVYQFGADFLTDETFTGAVWALKIPPAVIALANEIEAYNDGDAAKVSPYTSESFGGYSYTRATDANGAPIGWQEVFRSQMRKWRKL